VFTKEVLSILPDAKIRENSYRSNKQVDQLEEVYKMEQKEIKGLGNMKQNKMGWIDGLNSNYLLSSGHSIIVKPLTLYFKKSFDASEVPEDWKMG